MNPEEHAEQILELWHSIEYDLKLNGFGQIWIEKEEGKLGTLEHEVKNLEEEIIVVLQNIHAKKGEDVVEEHIRKFLKLIHNVKPTERWQEDIREELDELARIAKQLRALEQQARELRERARAISMARIQARRQKISQVPQSRIVQTVPVPAESIGTQIDLEKLSHTYNKIGKYLDNGLWAIPTQNPNGNYLYPDHELTSGVADDIVFKCYPNLPVEVRGWGLGSAFGFVKIKKLAWTSARLEDKRSAGINDSQLVPGEVIITDAFHHWKRNQEEEKRRRQEMIPPPKSMQELVTTTDKKSMVRMKVGDIIAIPFPIQNPKSYYLIPNPDSMYLQRVERLTKLYPDMEGNEPRTNYIIERAAWVSADVLKRARFEIDLIEATWTAEGEVGQVKKIK